MGSGIRGNNEKTLYIAFKKGLERKDGEERRICHREIHLTRKEVRRKPWGASIWSVGGEKTGGVALMLKLGKQRKVAQKVWAGC